MSPGQLDLALVHKFSDNLNINRGKHNFKLGGLYRYNIAKSVRSNLPRGQIDFTRDIAGLPRRVRGVSPWVLYVCSNR